MNCGLACWQATFHSDDGMGERILSKFQNATRMFEVVLPADFKFMRSNLASCNVKLSWNNSFEVIQNVFKGLDPLTD